MCSAWFFNVNSTVIVMSFNYYYFGSSFFGPCFYVICCIITELLVKELMILLWWEKFQYKISKLLSYVCFDFSLLWLLLKWEIASKMVNTIKIPKINWFTLFGSYNMYFQGTYVFFILVYICLPSDCWIIRKLHPKLSKLSKYQKWIVLWCRENIYLNYSS